MYYYSYSTHLCAFFSFILFRYNEQSAEQQVGRELKSSCVSAPAAVCVLSAVCVLCVCVFM